LKKNSFSWSSLFSTSVAGSLILIFAFAVGAATFIENDFGTATAQKVVYRAKWFELLLLLLSISLIVNIIKYKIYLRPKRPVFLFHIAMLVILLGSAVTRYTGYEGIMHIREGQVSNTILSDETFVRLIWEDESEERWAYDWKVLFGSLSANRFHKKAHIGDRTLNLKLLEFIPNAEETLEADDAGSPVVSLVLAAGGGREASLLKPGNVKIFKNLAIGFGRMPEGGGVQLDYTDGALSFQAPYPVVSMRMSDQHLDTLPPGMSHPLELMKLYTANGNNFVVNNFLPNGKVKLVSKSPKVGNDNPHALRFELSSEGEKDEIVVWGGKGVTGRETAFGFAGLNCSLAYGSKPIQIPFGLKLNDFQLERYPGSNSPSSFASEVTLLDERKGLVQDHRIYMNNVLNYGGFRFFQSSYDNDELGTVLSVNHDRPGTILSYLGYFMLALGMAATLFSKNSRFQTLARKGKRAAKTAVGAIALLLMLPSGALLAELPIDSLKVVSEAHAEKFGQLLVQDIQGRMKPMNTLASEVVRKVSRKTELFGQNPDQILLGMLSFSDQWQNLPMIKVSHDQIKEMLGIEGGRATFNDFYEEGTGYILKEYVDKAHQLKPAQRGQFDKDILKIDERVSICYLIYSGELLQLFPKPNDPNHKWYSPVKAVQADFGEEGNMFVRQFFPLYLKFINEGEASGDWQQADELVDYLAGFQRNNGGEEIPSVKKMELETRYNGIDIFPRLAKWYGMVGFVLLLLLFLAVFFPAMPVKAFSVVGAVLLGLGFLTHTGGLALRWYISGHAPWSNGYESLIYIAWATLLAGIIFSRRSPITLAATSVLSSLVLFVAGMSWMDPEITPLVPVLKSYWLTIHVSMITASYGFLALGALLGFLNLLLMIFRSKRSESTVGKKIAELTRINEMTLTVGLILLSIGTFLGGIWANESWGRYWGWDAKETWALVTILVYSFMLHMRLIPGLKGVFPFNFASLIGYSSVIMTYFGVNYYLSGLHSYAAGDPVPIPTFVYYTLSVIALVSALAYYRHRSVQNNQVS